jgi:hypothetical protein
MRTTTTKATVMAGGVLAAVVAGYLGVMALAAPDNSGAVPVVPAAASSPGPALPTKGQFERAVQLAEAQTGGVTIKGEAKNGNGIYEIDVVLGNEEIEVLVDTTREQVTELKREVEPPFDD